MMSEESINKKRNYNREYQRRRRELINDHLDEEEEELNNERYQVKRQQQTLPSYTKSTPTDEHKAIGNLIVAVSITVMAVVLIINYKYVLKFLGFSIGDEQPDDTTYDPNRGW